MHKLFILFIALITVVSTSAQDSIVVKKDPRLDVLTSKQAAANKRNSMMTSSGQYKGFRVQVMSTRDRTKAVNTKAELLTRYPEEKSYTVYQSPYFKVRIGNFIKKEDAEAFRKVLSRFYPEGVFVVPDVIDYTPPEEEELIID
jgi:hypothetical protein